MTPSALWPYSCPMKLPPFYDGLGALVTLLLLLAVIVYPLCGQEVPQFILLPFTTATGWVFRGSVGAANDWWHQKRSTPNGAASPTGPASPSPQ